MDKKLLFLINREWINPVLDRCMALASCFEAWIPLLAILIFVLIWRGGFRARAFVVTAGIVVGFNDAVLSNPLKHLVHRPRPAQEVVGVRQVDLAKARPRLLALGKPLKVTFSAPTAVLETPGRAFPSSHTINTISVAVITACFFRSVGWISVLPALLVAYSRIYTGSHWPSDVLISLFLGAGATLLLLGGLDWLWRTRGAGLSASVHLRHPSLFAQ